MEKRQLNIARMILNIFQKIIFLRFLKTKKVEKRRLFTLSVDCFTNETLKEYVF